MQRFPCAVERAVARGSSPRPPTRWQRIHSPNSLLLGALNALKNDRLGAGWSGRVPGRLVSQFFSFVSQFFSFVSQAGCLWSGSWLACLPLPFVCFPLLFNCLPVLFTCLPSSGLSPTSFHLSPNSFHLSLPGWALVVGFPVVSHFFSFVSQAGCLWSASLPFICLPGTVLVVGFPASLSPTSLHLSPTSFHLSPTSFHLSPGLGACGGVHFLSFVSQARCLWSGFRPACLPLSFICLPLLFCILISVGPPSGWGGFGVKSVLG